MEDGGAAERGVESPVTGEDWKDDDQHGGLNLAPRPKAQNLGVSPYLEKGSLKM